MTSHSYRTGDELLLQCVITGDPEPSLQWMRNGNILQMGREEGVFTSFREGVARLRLRDVGVGDGGEYMCVARNKGGQVKCTSRVTVKGLYFSWFYFYFFLRFGICLFCFYLLLRVTVKGWLVFLRTVIIIVSYYLISYLTADFSIFVFYVVLSTWFIINM